MPRRFDSPTQYLENENGVRKYLNAAESAAFRDAAEQQPIEIALFALTLYHTGCRISEALALRRDNLDLERSRIWFRTLKQRSKKRYRRVPVQPAFIQRLAGLKPSGRFWTFHRTTGWRRIKSIMAQAGIAAGPFACPKGLRHGFGIACVESNIDYSCICKWMGHADINTTMIYVNTVGKEELEDAKSLWLRDMD